MKGFPQILTCLLRRLSALSLAAAVLNLSAAVSFAAPAGATVALGTLQARGVVTVNELPALTGQTIFSGSKIVTASRSVSILELGNFTRLILSEQSELALNFSAASITGVLQKGEMRAFIPAARTLTITTVDGVVATDSSQPVVFSVQVAAGLTHITVETGRVELRAGSSRRVLAAGESFLTECDSLTLPATQHLGTSGRVGIVAGIGVGVAAILTALTGREPKEVLDFGGCVVVSDILSGPGMCG